MDWNLKNLKIAMKKNCNKSTIEVSYCFHYLPIMRQVELLHHQKQMKILQNVEDIHIAGQEMLHLLPEQWTF